jgi:hypothetical protein
LKFRKYQSFSHWLSYNWGIPLGILLVTLLGVYAWHNQQNQQEVDYRLCWVGTSFLSSDEQQALTDLITANGTDQTGDGEIVVEIDQYYINFQSDGTDDDAEDSYNYSTKLLTRLQDRDCYLFLLEDPEGFQRSMGVLRYLDGSVPGEDDGYECANWAQMCVPFQCEGLEHTAYLARRSLFEAGEEYDVLFPGGEDLFLALTQDASAQ